MIFPFLDQDNHFRVNYLVAVVADLLIIFSVSGTESFEVRDSTREYLVSLGYLLKSTVST